MLTVENTVLIVVDVQGKLASLMHEHEILFGSIERMIKAAQSFEIPIIWTEQAPHKIGETIPLVKDLLSPRISPIHKTSFSCYDCFEFQEALKKNNKNKLIVIGIETHVCVYQTVRDLSYHGYEVHCVANAVSSRKQLDKDLAIARMRDENITITSAEMAICELLKTAENPKFKEIMTYIKR